MKHYSSGMYVRLGFAVAVNVDPDILLVDEVLAVGDEVFQKKCIDRIEQIQREGRTIVFVTHAADTVRQICDRVIVLDHGDWWPTASRASRSGSSASTCTGTCRSPSPTRRSVATARSSSPPSTFTTTPIRPAATCSPASGSRCASATRHPSRSRTP